MPGDEPMNRRRFFREGLRELLKPLAQAVEPLSRVADELGRLEERSAKGAEAHAAGSRRHPLEVWLRPPGARPEADFIATCTRCGDCLPVCPVRAIRLDPAGRKGAGFPYIEPEEQACIACADLPCIAACKPAALLPTPLTQIAMGTALVREGSCLRTAGEDCTLCVQKCPVGEVAIDVHEGRIRINPLGCIGCGSCQQACPTSPRSIVVIPRAARENARAEGRWW